jgi:hypothetical protein
MFAIESNYMVSVHHYTDFDRFHCHPKPTAYIERLGHTDKVVRRGCRRNRLAIVGTRKLFDAHIRINGN